MRSYQKPLPRIDTDTGPFWEGCKRRELLLQRCLDCGNYIWYPRHFCGHCLSDNSEWVPASGKGTVYTYTVIRQTRARGFRDEVPYVVAYIELDEGVIMMSNIVRVDPQKLHVGMPVQVSFDAATEEVTLPKFRPAG
jgi:uncharacterized OB-fold protein